MSPIQEKLAKLFAMAENNSNENEVAIALAKAEKLMQEYNLSKEDILTDNEKYVTIMVEYGNGKNGEDWKDYFAMLIAKINFCKSFSAYSGPKVYFFGKQKNVDLCIWQFNNVITQMQIICDMRFSEYKMTGGNIHGKTWKKSFYFGAYTEIKKKLDVMKQSSDLLLETLPENKQQLIALSQELEVEYRNHNPNLKNTTSKFGLNSGFVAGQESGKSFSFQTSLK